MKPKLKLIHQMEDYKQYRSAISGAPSTRLSWLSLVIVDKQQQQQAQSAKISFSSFRQGFASTTNFLKRRFSSGDLSGEEGLEDEVEDRSGRPASAAPNRNEANAAPTHSASQSSDLTLNFRGSNQPVAATTSSKVTSAPTSPHHSGVSSFLSRATSLTGSVTSTVQQIARTATNKDRQKILLVIDDNQTDWSKYFRGKRLQGEWDIRVEQGEFRDITLTSHSESGTVVSIIGYDRSGSKVARDVRDDHRDILLGLAFGNVKTLPTCQQAFNFQDRPWVFSQLLGIQRRLGKDNFPLIEQTFYPNHRDTTAAPRFPCVVKIGPSHSGQGKMKVESMQDFHDLASVVAVTRTYCTIEPFVDSKCDVHIQKIGTNLKAYARKSISGNWKANVGSAVLEQIPVNDKFRKWIEEVSETFGGLDICAIELIVGKDGKEYIIEVTGSAMTLLGESQEEDRRSIADLVVQRMQYFCRPGFSKRMSVTTGSTEEQPSDATQSQPPHVTSNAVPMAAKAQNQPQMNQPSQRGQSLASQQRPPPPALMQRRGSSGAKQSQVIANAGLNNPFSQNKVVDNVGPNPTPAAEGQPNPQQSQSRPTLFRRSSQTSNEETKTEEGDDTMRNLRKTFAGIFGDM